MSDTIVASDLMEQVEAALDTMRPFLAADGGNVRLLEITDEMVARVELLGSCRSCNMSEMTMKAGIEEAVKKAVPAIISVVSMPEC